MAEGSAQTPFFVRRASVSALVRMAAQSLSVTVVETSAAPSASDTSDDDPFQVAAAALSDAQARGSIERILLLYGRLAAGAGD